MATSTTSNKLDMSGIYIKGYGTVPKSIFLDSLLTVGSKTLYAYFCAITGQEKQVTISREKIIYDLDICKETYYRLIKPLLKSGYIEIEKSGVKNIYSKNTYKLNNAPKNSDKPVRAGYGLISRLVMTDNTLSVKAKGIFAYACAFSGTTHRSYQKKSVMNAHLGINDKTCTKHMKELTEANYMVVTQRRKDARYGVNDYYINVSGQSEAGISVTLENIAQAEPEVITQTQPCGNAQLHSATKKQNADVRDDGAQSTNLPYTKIQSTKIQSTKKQDTYLSNNIINNSSLNINPFNQASSENLAGNYCQGQIGEANPACVSQSPSVHAEQAAYVQNNHDNACTRSYQAKPKKYSQLDSINVKFDTLFNESIQELCHQSENFEKWINRLTRAQREYLPENFKTAIREQIRNIYIHNVPAYIKESIRKWLISQFKLEEFDLGPSSMPTKKSTASYDIEELERMLG